jgi:hypothetical protein
MANKRTASQAGLLNDDVDEVSFVKFVHRRTLLTEGPASIVLPEINLPEDDNLETPRPFWRNRVTRRRISATLEVAPVLQAVAPVLQAVAPVLQAVAPVLQAVAPVSSAYLTVAMPVLSTSQSTVLLSPVASPVGSIGSRGYGSLVGDYDQDSDQSLLEDQTLLQDQEASSLPPLTRVPLLPPLSPAAGPSQPIKVQTKEEPKVCPICQDVLEMRGDNFCLPCMHLYHSACIQAWFKVKPECPLCRHRVAEDEDEDEDEDSQDSQTTQLWRNSPTPVSPAYRVNSWEN